MFYYEKIKYTKIMIQDLIIIILLFNLYRKQHTLTEKNSNQIDKNFIINEFSKNINIESLKNFSNILENVYSNQKLTLPFNVIINGDVDVSNKITSDLGEFNEIIIDNKMKILNNKNLYCDEKINGDVINFLPKNSIVIWKGALNTIPEGWVVCDGTNGTPNLQGRFVVGVGNEYSLNSKGGTTTETLTLSQIPAHKHTCTTSSAGRHKHNDYTVYLHNRSSGHQYYHMYQWHIDIKYFLPSHSHNHGGSFTTSSTGSNHSHNNMPKYRALYFIMKKK